MPVWRTGNNTYTIRHDHRGRVSSAAAGAANTANLVIWAVAAFHRAQMARAAASRRIDVKAEPGSSQTVTVPHLSVTVQVHAPRVARAVKVPLLSTTVQVHAPRVAQRVAAQHLSAPPLVYTPKVAQRVAVAHLAVTPQVHAPQVLVGVIVIEVPHLSAPPQAHAPLIIQVTFVGPLVIQATVHSPSVAHRTTFAGTPYRITEIEQQLALARRERQIAEEDEEILCLI